MRARFVVLNVMVLALGVAAWRAGVLAPFWSLGTKEYALLIALGIYFCVGLGAAWMGNWDRCAAVANALPGWALFFTVVGLMLAASELHSLTPAALSAVFRDLVYAISANAVGILGYSWLTMLCDWAREPS